ncbi:hypothetical protein MHEL_12180 [Mycolicibacterium helvum]|uniref:Uncharacterized protein n=1 Tax=Mycolicibacterium helvum TaxID=1534349 RepID=A0A7I7T447_9MYCO|nr:hypothetical protein MHEL_12180 [Mycolicibacterium helvum]
MVLAVVGGCSSAVVARAVPAVRRPRSATLAALVAPAETRGSCRCGVPAARVVPAVPERATALVAPADVVVPPVSWLS